MIGTTIVCLPKRHKRSRRDRRFLFSMHGHGWRQKYNAHADVLKEDIKNKEAKAEWNLVLRSIEWINLAVVKEEGEEVAQGPEKKEEGGGESESTDRQESSDEKKVVQQLKQEED
mmetsp:Transcript_14472/g.29133  ORF Transcript_14472/g.29133 Transcript_14472/m.29133 type:complete len:115 (-) Transcript_14472:163-507(-)